MNTTYIALLRGINVGGRTSLPMEVLRDVCINVGCRDVRTYIQSGNVIFKAGESPVHLERMIEAAVAERWGLVVPAIVRAAADWMDCMRSNPFPEASHDEPNRVMLVFSKSPPAPDALDVLRARAAADERVEASGGALWIHYGSGAGRSKLTPAFLDRSLGSPATSRNWRTVLKLGQMLTA